MATRRTRKPPRKPVVPSDLEPGLEPYVKALASWTAIVIAREEYDRKRGIGLWQLSLVYPEAAEVFVVISRRPGEFVLDFTKGLVACRHDRALGERIATGEWNMWLQIDSLDVTADTVSFEQAAALMAVPQDVPIPAADLRHRFGVDYQWADQGTA